MSGMSESPADGTIAAAGTIAAGGAVSSETGLLSELLQVLSIPQDQLAPCEVEQLKSLLSNLPMFLF